MKNDPAILWAQDVYLRNLEVSMIFLDTLKETEALINIVIWFHNIDYQ